MSCRCWYCAWKVMVLSNSATTASKPLTSCTEPCLEAGGQRAAPGSPGARCGGRWTAAASRRRASCGRSARRSSPQRVAGQVSSTRSASTGRVAALGLLAACSAQPRRNSCSARTISVPLVLRQAFAHRGGRLAQRSAGCSRRCRRSRRRPARRSASARTRAATCVQAGTSGSTSALRRRQLAAARPAAARGLVLAVQAFERRAAPAAPRSRCARCSGPSQNRFSAARLVTRAAAVPRQRRPAGVRLQQAWCGRPRLRCSTQVSALLPPRCIEAISSVARRRCAPARPAARATSCGPSLTANTRSMQRARHDAAAAAVLRPGRHLRQRQVGLHRVCLGLAHDAAGPFVEFARDTMCCPAPRRSWRRRRRRDRSA